MTAVTITQNANKSWTFQWSGSADYWRVVLWGVQLTITTGTSYIWAGQEYKTFPPPLEIASEDTPVPSELYSAFWLVQWFGIPTAVSYTIQQYNYGNGQWGNVAVLQATGLYVYTWKTPILTDGTTYRYRVFATDSVGNASSPREFQKYIVTNPVPPDNILNITYSNPNIVVAHS